MGIGNGVGIKKYRCRGRLISVAPRADTIFMSNTVMDMEMEMVGIRRTARRAAVVTTATFIRLYYMDSCCTVIWCPVLSYTALLWIEILNLKLSVLSQTPWDETQIMRN
jgi:hypothetical protein